MPQLRSDDLILLECPACGASESADPAVLIDEPTIVCRNCGETWSSAPKRRRRELALRTDTLGRDVVEAERRPLITFSDGAEKAWALKVEGDILPEQPPEPRRAPLVAAATIAALFIACFVGAREAAVRAVPDLAGLYAAIRLPVNLDGLAIEDLEAERLSTDGAGGLIVRGEVRNLAGRTNVVPPLVAYFPAADGGAAQRRFDPPAEGLAPGETAPFELTIADAPADAGEIFVRFLRPAESGDGV